MNRTGLYYLIWTVVFGVALAIGGSTLEIIRIPFLNVTLATFWVIVLVTVNKIVIARPLSVTCMYVVVGTIAIFTPFLGPPSPLKPIIIIAGFSFDLATRFRTKNIRLFDLILGNFALTIMGFSLVWVIFRVHTPALAPALVPIFIVGSAVHFAISIIISYVLFGLMKPDDPPEDIKRIRDQVGGGGYPPKTGQSRVGHVP